MLVSSIQLTHLLETLVQAVQAAPQVTKTCWTWFAHHADVLDPVDGHRAGVDQPLLKAASEKLLHDAHAALQQQVRLRELRHARPFAPGELRMGENNMIR